MMSVGFLMLILVFNVIVAAVAFEIKERSFYRQLMGHAISRTPVYMNNQCYYIIPEGEWIDITRKARR